jgi:endonuclease-3
MIDVKKALKILEKEFSIIEWWRNYTPFEILIAVILSQATERKNTMIAFENLRKHFDINPKELAKADEREIQKCIRPAGLHNIKSKRIKEISKLVLNYGGIEKILQSPNAREILLSMPGVGNKTADILLSFTGVSDEFPIDTHIARIAKRWGMVKDNATYKDIKRSFEKIIPPGKRCRMHILLIEFGRKCCTARNPKCNICPIKTICGGCNEDL